VGLTGEVRRVSQLDRRLQEAARRGFKRAIVPAQAMSATGLQAVPVADIGAALKAAFGRTGAKLTHSRET
jgi:DNA repair protein RadA/Sms